MIGAGNTWGDGEGVGVSTLMGLATEPGSGGRVTNVAESVLPSASLSVSSTVVASRYEGGGASGVGPRVFNHSVMPSRGSGVLGADGTAVVPL